MVHKHHVQMVLVLRPIMMVQEHLNTKDLKHHAVATIPGVQRVSFKKKVPK